MNMYQDLFIKLFYAYSVVMLGKQQDGLRCQHSLRGREPGRAQAGASIDTNHRDNIKWEVGEKKESSKP